MKTFSKSLFLYLLFVILAEMAVNGEVVSGDKDDREALSKAHQSIISDLADSNKRYSEQASFIQTQKLKISRKLLKLESENQNLRDQSGFALRQRDSQTMSIEKLEYEVENLEQVVSYIENLLRDYASSFNKELPVGERKRFEAQLKPLLSFQPSGNWSDKIENLESGFMFLESSVRRSFELLGGYQYEGEAILENGLLSLGRFSQIGPFSSFTATKTQDAGIIDLSDYQRARLIMPDNWMKVSELSELDSKQKGWLYLDPTLFDAVEISKIKRNWLDEVRKGGIWIYPILFFASVSFLVALFKSVQVYSVRRPQTQEIENIILHLRKQKEEGQTATYKLHCPGPIGDSLRVLLENATENKELLEEMLYERILEAQSNLEKYLPLIAITMATAPLLGLLGTVTGMIETFRQIMLFGSSDMGNLAGGISEALVTTKYGLISAIPALIIHSLLSRKIQGILSEMEKTGSAILNSVQITGKK